MRWYLPPVRSRNWRAALASVALCASVAGFALPLPARAAAPPSIPACGGANAASDLLPSAVPLERGGAPAPAITAQAAVVVDGETGRVLYDLRAHERRPPASTTKIMTALLTVENADLNRVVVSDVDASTMVGSSVMGLRPGVPISVADLLYGLMLPSGNDAAIALARAIDGDVGRFVQRMNERAAELQLHDTHFANPHGLDRRSHYSSAYDLAMLARTAMANPTFATVVGTAHHHLQPPSDYDLHNGNSMLTTYPGADGVKIGWTERAGWTLVASAQRDGRRLFAVVLHSEDRDADAGALLDWAWDANRWLPLSPQVSRTMQLARTLGLGDRFRRALAVCR